jgi:hypothetical protein
MSYKPGDKFILEIGDRQLDEYEIAGTDYYIKIYLLKKLAQYDSVSQIATFINKMKTVFNLLSDEEIDEYNNIYNDRSTEEFIKWINQKYEKY